MVHAYIDKGFHEIFVDVGQEQVVSHEVLQGKHSHVDAAYMGQVEDACLQDTRVQAAIEKLKLPKDATVIVEPWTYATDGANDMDSRITMVRMLPCAMQQLTGLDSAGFTCGFATTKTQITTRIL